MKHKVETLQEYLARGGTIKIVPPNTQAPKEQANRKADGPAVILTLDEYDTYYGEKKKESKEKKPKKPKQKLDLNALPEKLRLKYIARAAEEAGIDEEEIEKA